MATKPEVQIWPDRQTLAQAAAERFILLAGRRTVQNKLFRVLLSGGSTPRAMHQILSQPDYSGQIDWIQVHIFWGDERCVPPDHPDSNYRMAVETLLKHVPIPADNIHRIFAELPPQIAAEDYQSTLSTHFKLAPDKTGRPVPRFDLVLLGLGADGHTASLFPGSKAVAEKQAWVTSIPHDKPPEPLVPRVTITLPVIRAAIQVLFLVAGSDKAERLKQVLGPASTPPLPAQLAKPTNGKLLWMVDRAAAAQLDGFK